MAPPSKKQKLNNEEPTYEWVQASQADLHVATAVLYEAMDGPRRGVIYDAFEPVDHYWVEDEETREVVRNEAGDCHDFNSADLKVPKAISEGGLGLVPEEQQEQPRFPSAGVLLIGSEQQMVKILQHFGTPNTEERTIPQQLIAIPCGECVDGLAQHASQGVSPGLRELGQRLRDDISVALRVAHLKQVATELGPELQKLTDYFCLASVHLPFPWEEIKAATGAEAQRRQDLWNQIDLCVTALGEGQPEHSGPVDTAREVLGEHCGMEVSDGLWREEVQTRLRSVLGLEGMPLRLKDPWGAEIFPLLLPADAGATSIHGVLCFSEAPEAWYLTQDAPPEAPEASRPSEETREKTVRDWEALQDEFADLPPLPVPWIRVRSRKDGQVYFFNKETHKASFTEPVASAAPARAPVPVPPPAPAPAPARSSNGLPPGWTQHVSKSNGKVYYFHEASNKSQYFFPRQ